MRTRAMIAIFPLRTMSSAQQAIEDFFALCSSDPSLRKQLKELNDEQIVELANNKGFSFSLDDLQDVLDPSGADRELETKELELVAGGAKALNAVSDGLVCNTIRSLFSTESGCGGGFKIQQRI